jgi:ribosomal protein L9
MTATVRSIDLRVTELEKNEAVNDAERAHINKRLESLDAKMVDIGKKVDQGFEKVYASLRWPIGVVFLAFVGVIVKWIAGGGLAG